METWLVLLCHQHCRLIGQVGAVCALTKLHLVPGYWCIVGDLRGHPVLGQKLIDHVRY